MTDHIIGFRRSRGVGWVSGVVHARVRHGTAALELRGTAHHLTLQGTLESLTTPARLNGHAGVTSELVGATAGHDARDQLLRLFLDAPGATLLFLWGRSGLTLKEWARRAGVNVSTIRRVCYPGGTQVPSIATAARLLGALQ